MKTIPDPNGALALRFWCRLSRSRDFPLKKFLMQKLRQRYLLSTGPVRANVHGFDVLLNPGNTYPFIIHEFRTFNAPLIELTFQVFRMKCAPINFLDVGAATGDSILLLKHHCPNVLAKWICVEGDPEFFAFLGENMKQFSDVTIIHAVLARESVDIRSLVKHHKGTAAAIGCNFISAHDLDSLDHMLNAKIDIIKIDVDGFDGEVLAGARNLLALCRPAVIFEWHPHLVRATGNDPLAAFATLEECGYDRFLWFNNIGTFNHFSSSNQKEILLKEAEYLLRVNERFDEHFDVIALPKESNIDDLALATMQHARESLMRQ